MATNFPTSLDTLTNPSATDTLDSPPHDEQHADANDAIEALQAKVGVDGSAVTSSHDYILTNGVLPTLNVDSGVLVVDDSNNRVGVNDASPSYALDVTGDINASGDIKLAGDSMPRGIVGSDVLAANVSLTTSAQTALSVTFTRVAGRTYYAIVSAVFALNSSSGALYRYDVDQDAVRLFPGRITTSSSSQLFHGTAVVPLVGGSTSTTITVDVSVNSGTGLFEGSSTIKSNLLILDVGT